MLFVIVSGGDNLIIYNGIDLSSYLRITDIRGRGIVEVEFNEMTVPGRDGSYFVSKRKPKRIIENDYKISASTQTELRQKIDELNAILDVDGPVPIEYADEPGKTYYGMAYSDGQSQQILSYEKGTLFFVCFDRYKYGPIITQTINDPSGGEANPIVLNDGTAETYPIFTATILQPTTFLQIVSQDAYMQVGQPYDVDQTPVDGDKPVMKDLMQTTTGWGAASSVVDGIVQGTMVSDGDAFIVQDYGPAYNGWAGPALKKSFPNAEQLQDFRVYSLIDIKSSAAGTGRIEIYGLDAANNYVFRASIGDHSAQSENVDAFFEIGQNTDLMWTTYGVKKGSMNSYYGQLTVERQGNVWTFTVGRWNGKEFVETLSHQFVDTEQKYSQKLAQVQVHIGSHLSYQPLPKMSINNVFVYKLVGPGSQDEVPYIAYPGDELIFDHKKALIRKNGDIWMREKDFGASFFPLEPGYTELAINPSDVATVTVEYQPRWK